MRKIKVLGGGCAKCESLAANADEAAKSLGIEYELAKVTDINEITGFGVMVTPALVIDGEVRLTGKVAGVEEIKKMLGK